MATIPPAPLPVHIHSTTRISPLLTSSLLTGFLAHASISPSHRPDSTLTNQTSGPQSNSGGTGTVNLTLFHLERLKRGIDGEDLGFGKAEGLLLGDGLEGGGGEAQNDGEGRGQKRKRRTQEHDTDAMSSANKKTPQHFSTGKRRDRVAEEDEAAGTAAAVGDGTQASEWQDKETYEREQVVEEGEVGERDPATIPEFGVNKHVEIARENADERDVDGENEVIGARTVGVEAPREVIEDGAKNEKEKQPMTGREKEDRKKRKKEKKKEERREREMMKAKSK